MQSVKELGPLKIYLRAKIVANDEKYQIASSATKFAGRFCTCEVDFEPRCIATGIDLELDRQSFPVRGQGHARREVTAKCLDSASLFQDWLDRQRMLA